MKDAGATDALEVEVGGDERRCGRAGAVVHDGDRSRVEHVAQQQAGGPVGVVDHREADTLGAEGGGDGVAEGVGAEAQDEVDTVPEAGQSDRHVPLGASDITAERAGVRQRQPVVGAQQRHHLAEGEHVDSRPSLVGSTATGLIRSPP